MKKKILIFTNGLYGGGAETVLQTILNNLDYNQFDVTLYSLNKENVLKTYHPNICYHYIFHPFSPNDNRLKRIVTKISNKIKLFIYHHCSARLFYRLFVKGTFDTEVAFIEGYATRIVSGSVNKDSQKIAWVHIDLKQNHWTDVAYRSKEEEQEAYQRFDEIISVSDNVRNSFRSLFIHPHTTVCYNPIDERKIKLLGNAPVDSFDWDIQRPMLVTVGRLVPQKGYDRLLSVVKRLKEEGYAFSLNIIGEGSDRSRLEQYITDNHLQTTVRLIGFQPNPYPFMKQSDLFICSSRAEGYSTAVTEALILGLPILTTACAGMHELLGESEYGLIVDNNEQALYKGLKRLLCDKNCYKQYKTKSEERGKQISLDALMNKIIDKLR